MAVAHHVFVFIANERASQRLPCLATQAGSSTVSVRQLKQKGVYVQKLLQRAQPFCLFFLLGFRCRWSSRVRCRRTRALLSFPPPRHRPVLPCDDPEPIRGGTDDFPRRKDTGRRGSGTDARAPRPGPKLDQEVSHPRAEMRQALYLQSRREWWWWLWRCCCCC